ncbi:MarR family transcriptional regulator [Kitasatospora sp. NBC_00085]|uniref:MarR family transcriptional regulator n=1 Tax=unclassified Kitasatospora TaxID=2633591 RepID=UPI003243FC25
MTNQQAHEALIAFDRARQADFGFSRPQLRLLRHLSQHDLSPDGRGLTVAELRETMCSHLGPGSDLGADAAVLLELGWLTGDGEGRLWITESGEAARADLARHAPVGREQIHHGVDDAGRVTAPKVPRQMIRDAGGRPART